MIRKWSWFIILSYLFIRPFVSGITFKTVDLIINNIFLVAVCFWAFRKNAKQSSLDVLLALFVFSLILSLAFSKAQLRSIFHIYKFFPLLAMPYVLRTTHDVQDRKNLVVILMISALGICLYSLRGYFIVSKNIISYLAKQNIEHHYAVGFLATNRAFMPFVSPNLLAGYLAMLITLSTGMAIQQIKNNKKDILYILSITMLVLGTAVLFLTKSLSGVLALLVSLIFFFAMAKMINKKMLLVILLLLSLFVAMFSYRIQSKEFYRHPLFSLEKRIQYWKETILTIKEEPLTGVGIGNINLKKSRVAFSHNSYLQVWAEMGIVGFLAMIGLFILFIKKIALKASQKESSYFYLGILTTGICFFIHNLVDFSFYIPQVAFLWWVLFGFAEISDAAPV